ncbi:MAG: ABC transporter permease, partial [Candidatus Latescibacteria bacterium]|nr:ABC transporter permease [Candidatus Latescibacterota bacterium]
PPPMHQFRIAGIFDSGYYDYDNAVGLIDLAEAQKILGIDDMVSGVVLKLDKIFEAERYTRKDGLIDQVLGSYRYYSMSWMEKNKALFSWMKLEKWAASIVLSLIIIVAAFNIISSLIMMVMDKTSEVGILKSMGATNKSIHKIFVYQGAFVGICGTILGSTVGYSLCYLQDKYRLISLPSDIYFVSAVPVELQIRDFVAITVIALFLCWFSSFYPAKKAAELNPVDAIRSE